MNEKIKKAKESLEKLIEDISIDSGYSYPALYADIRAALNDFDRYHESQQDLIKGKDEYIAKLCNDRAELKEQLKDLQEFARIMATHTKTGGGDYISIHIVCDKGEKDYPILKEVVEKYGN